MTLLPGARLGPYDVLSALGAGGMGEVYRARDPKLNRDVAIKVLLPAVANDRNRLARFSREAQVLASLNHPNIAAIYGLEDGAGVRALVMELVEGPTLADRLTQGAIPIADALPIARQIADALEAAHEQGIIHRDLKPANIKLRPDGTVKVLDFGLAKATDPAGASGPNVMQSPTVSIHGTETGIILGTAAYMSPEQARGKAVDKRTDNWAFGVVVWEMLTGRNLFAAETVSDTIALVLTREFDWAALPPDTPTGVRRLLARALERDPKRRLRDIGDARVELDGAAADTQGTVETPRQRSFASRALRGAVIFAVGAATTSALFFAWPKMSSSDNGLGAMQFLITPRDGVAFADAFAMNFVLSPDGRQMLLRASDGGAFVWYVRSMTDGGVRRLDSMRTATGNPFWSPDGRAIGFITSGGSVSRIASDGSGLTAITPVNRLIARGGSWAANGEIVFVGDAAVMAVSDRGGQPRVVLAAEVSAPPFISTAALPGGRYVPVQQGGPALRILLVTLDGSGPARHLIDGMQPAYAAPGWLLAVTEAKLVAWKFNPALKRVEGAPVTIREIPRSREGLWDHACSQSPRPASWPSDPTP